MGEGLGWPGSRKALGELRIERDLATNTEEVQYLTKGLARQMCISSMSNLLNVKRCFCGLETQAVAAWS